MERSTFAPMLRDFANYCEEHPRSTDVCIIIFILLEIVADVIGILKHLF